MPSKRSGGCLIEPDRCVSSDSVRNPCAIGTFHGESCAACSGSTWMNWWSIVTSANWLMRSCVIWNQSPAPSASPTADLNSSYAASALLIWIRPLRSLECTTRMSFRLVHDRPRGREKPSYAEQEREREEREAVRGPQGQGHVQGARRKDCQLPRRLQP